MQDIQNKPQSFFQKIRSRKWLVLIGIIVIVGIGFFVRRSLVKGNQQPQYQTAQVQKGTVVVALTASGQVETSSSAEVDTQASGVISKVYVQEGQKVKSGQAIAKLDLDMLGKQKAQAALASYQNAKNQLAAAQADLHTLQSKEFVANQSFINGAVASNLSNIDPSYIEQDANWLAAEAQYKNQQAVINQAQLSVTQAWLSSQQTSDTIYASITGTITGLNIQEGSVIQGTNSSSTTASAGLSKIANIVTQAQPTIRVNLTEIDIPKVRLADKVTLIFDALPEKTFVGKVVSIDNVGSVTSNVTSYPVIIQLVDSNSDILPNMSASANIVTNSKTDVLVIPASAVQTNNGNTSVRIMKNGQPQSVDVTLGLTSDTQDEVISGLNEGDTIVTSVISTPRTASATTTTSPFSALTGGRNGGFGGGNTARVTTTR